MQTIPFIHPVALGDGEPADCEVVGELLAPDGALPDTVQLLIHGATYGRSYWDFPVAPERHSYARALTARGHALCGYDRIGSGDSSHPAPERVTMDAHVHVVDQLLAALSAGTLGASFSRVIVVGHSYGSVVATAVAAAHPELAGVVISGLLHRLDTGLGALAESLRPACEDTPERFGSLDPGYVTTTSGDRGVFYVGSDVEPAVLEGDEQLKQPYTASEAASFPAGLARSTEVSVPTLVVVGDHDAFFCTEEPCTAPGTGGLTLEPSSWTSTEPTFVAVPDAPHALNTVESAPGFFATVADWCEALGA